MSFEISFCFDFFQCMVIVSKITQNGGMYLDEYLLLKALILANVDLKLTESSKLIASQNSILTVLNSRVSSLRLV